MQIEHVLHDYVEEHSSWCGEVVELLFREPTGFKEADDLTLRCSGQLFGVLKTLVDIVERNEDSLLDQLSLTLNETFPPKAELTKNPKINLLTLAEKIGPEGVNRLKIGCLVSRIYFSNITNGTMALDPKKKKR